MARASEGSSWAVPGGAARNADISVNSDLVVDDVWSRPKFARTWT